MCFAVRVKQDFSPRPSSRVSPRPRLLAHNPRSNCTGAEGGPLSSQRYGCLADAAAPFDGARTVGAGAKTRMGHSRRAMRRVRDFKKRACSVHRIYAAERHPKNASIDSTNGLAFAAAPVTAFRDQHVYGEPHGQSGSPKVHQQFNHRRGLDRRRGAFAFAGIGAERSAETDRPEEKGIDEAWLPKPAFDG